MTVLAVTVYCIAQVLVHLRTVPVAVIVAMIRGRTR